MHPDGEPLVSIVMPAFNQARYIGAAIESVLAQTHTHWELIIVDDGSTDDTRDVVGSYHDERIRCRFQANQERSRARNAGIALCRGTLVAFLDADDYWLPTYLERQVASFAHNPRAGLSRTWCLDTDAGGVPVRVGGNGAANARSDDEFLAALLAANRMASHAVVVRVEVLADVGTFDPELRQGEDWELWVRIARRYPVAHVHEPLAAYRHYNAYMPRRLADRGYEQAVITVIERNHAGLEGPEWRARHRAALGDAYLRAAWNRYALGDVGAAKELLTTAVDTLPALAESPHRRLVEIIGHCADELYDLYTPLDEALAVIDRLFDNLPDDLQSLKRLRGRVRGAYCGLCTFRSYERRDRAATRVAASMAMRWKTSWVLNRGFLAIAWRAHTSLGWPGGLDAASSAHH